MSKCGQVIGHDGLNFLNGYLKYIKNEGPNEAQLSDMTNQFLQMNILDT